MIEQVEKIRVGSHGWMFGSASESVECPECEDDNLTGVDSHNNAGVSVEFTTEHGKQLLGDGS